jgi:hypothetical protein
MARPSLRSTNLAAKRQSDSELIEFRPGRRVVQKSRSSKLSKALQGIKEDWPFSHAVSLNLVTIMYYAGPPIAGLIVALFLLKPLIIRPPRAPRPVELSRETEPLLFDFNRVYLLRDRLTPPVSNFRRSPRQCLLRRLKCGSLAAFLGPDKTSARMGTGSGPRI